MYLLIRKGKMGVKRFLNVYMTDTDALASGNWLQYFASLIAKLLHPLRILFSPKQSCEPIKKNKTVAIQSQLNCYFTVDCRDSLIAWTVPWPHRLHCEQTLICKGTDH